MSTVATSRGETCPSSNICELTQPGSSACGKSFNHLDPLLPAEGICPTALANNVAWIDLAECEYPDTLAADQERMAWYEVERALHPDMDAELSDDCLVAAEEYIRQIKENRFSNFEVLHRASLLDIYLPAFEARCPGVEPLSDGDWLDITKDSAELSRTILDIEIHTRDMHTEYSSGHKPCLRSEEVKTDLLASETVSLLLLDAGLEIYPTSLRERRNNRKGKIAAHTGYLLHDDDTKLPIESRLDETGELSNGHTYRQSLMFIGFAALIEKASIKTLNWADYEGRAAPDMPLSPGDVLDLTSRYILGRRQSHGERFFVESMQRIVEKKITKKIDAHHER